MNYFLIMDSKPSIVILEKHLATPSQDSEPEFSLPLSFFDMGYLNFYAIPDIFFYKYEHPRTYFTENTIPELKEALALTLKHYLPLAGKLIYPLDSSGKPKFSYVRGDSIPLIFAESRDDFEYLTSDHARDADRFYPLIPPLPPAMDESNSKLFKLLSLQVTLFPNTGIAIGLIAPHHIGDASSIIGFVRTWASVTKHGSHAHLVATGDSLPVFDRGLIKDPYGLGENIWSLMKGSFQILLDPLKPPMENAVRATFILSKTDIDKLKALVLSKQPNIPNVSAYVVTCAYIWTCITKARVAIGEEVNGEEDECYRGPMDFRPRLDPPIPANYFGNCIAPVTAKTEHFKLIGEEGFLTSALLIREAINERMKNIDGILKGDHFIQTIPGASFNRMFVVAGSPKFDAYGVDFGWGKPEKFECITVPGAMSLSNSKFEGSLEAGLYLPKNLMDAFTTIFAEGFKNIYLSHPQCNSRI